MTSCTGGRPDAAATTVEAVESLAEALEAHLALEEASLAAALDAVSQVVSEEDVPPPPPDHLSP